MECNAIISHSESPLGFHEGCKGGEMRSIGKFQFNFKGYAENVPCFKQRGRGGFSKSVSKSVYIAICAPASEALQVFVREAIAIRLELEAIVIRLEAIACAVDLFQCHFGFTKGFVQYLFGALLAVIIFLVPPRLSLDESYKRVAAWLSSFRVFSFQRKRLGQTGHYERCVGVKLLACWDVYDVESHDRYKAALPAE